jgi:nucleoside-diphosphate-sugar epimerase
MNKSILITGGSGMLGAYLIRWFRQLGYTSITATYHSDEKRIPEDIREGVHWVPLSLPDQEACHDIVAGHEWVIHAAGLVSYHPGDKYTMLDIHQTGTMQMINACLAHDVSHFIYVGSISALGKEHDHMVLDENAPWLDNEFSTSYGLSKYLGELEAWRGAAEGLNVSVILPSVILGTGDWNRSSLQMIKRVVEKRGWYPTGQTGFVDVRDVCSFISILLKKEYAGQRWILSAGDMTFKEMYLSIAKELKMNKTFRPAPKWLAKLILYKNQLLGIKSTGSEILEQAYGHFSYDARKSLTIEGFRYRPIQESIRDVCGLYLGKGK